MEKLAVKTDTFNARYLSFTEVAEGFIMNDYFNELFYNGHSLLMGPRGCGKTTLLKMLHPAALIHYDKTNKTNLLSIIPFWTVYIPTDVQWKKQIEQISTVVSGKLVTIISKGTVTINVLVSLCKTYELIIQKITNENEALYKEANLCQILIDKWKLTGPIVPNLRSIEIALLGIVSDLNASISFCSINGGSPDIHKLFYYDYLELVNIACEAFEGIVTSSKSRWALCFDELEIAPEWLRNTLLSSLRSRSQRILFKLTTAPVVSFYDIDDLPDIISNPTENNDFQVVKIWTSNQNEFKKWFKFCDKLLETKINLRWGNKYTAKDLFGISDMDRLISDRFPLRFDLNKHNFLEDTPSNFAFKELASFDESFAKFLKRKKINIENPVPNSTRIKDQVFRKIKQLVIYRLEVNNSKMGLRSRKVIPFYFGIPLLYEISDGNPRVLISIIDELLLPMNLENKTFPFSINEQSRIVSNISNTYLNVLSSHPEATIQLHNKNYNLQELLDTIGNYFFHNISSGPFKMDPHGSFRVDADVNSKIVRLLELALYLGAIVYLDKVDLLSTEGIIGKRFRLTYALAPHYHLLARDYDPVPLSDILHKKVDTNQNSLFSL